MNPAAPGTVCFGAMANVCNIYNPFGPRAHILPLVFYVWGGGWEGGSKIRQNTNKEQLEITGTLGAL